MRFRRRARGDDLLDRELLVACEDPGLELGEQVLSATLGIGVRGTETTDGAPVLPVFTNETRLVEWFPEGSPWVGLSGRDILALFLNGEWEAMVIDPTQPNRREIFRDEAQALLSGS